MRQGQRSGAGVDTGDVMGDGMGMGRGGRMSVTSLRNLRTFSSFKNPVFRIYFGAMLGQMAGMNMQMFARSFLVFRLTESYQPLGVLALANALPMLLFSLFGGVIADRVQKKYVLLAGQAGSALVSVAIGVSLTLGYLSEDRPNSWLILVVASLAQGTIMGLMMPSRQAIIREIVGEEDLMNAVSLNALGMNLLRLVGPAMAGFLAVSFGYEAVYYTMTGMYVWAFALALFLPLTGTISIRGQGAFADIQDGFQYVWRTIIIRYVLLITLFTVFLSMPYQMLLPGFVIEVLNQDEGAGGVLMMVSGVGAVIGSLVLASLPNKKRGLLFMGTSILLAVALLGFSASQWWYVSMAVIFFVGIGQTGRMALGSTLLQYYAAQEYRGRVMSFMMMEFGLTSFSVFFAALAAESFGVQWAVGGLAALLLVLSIAVLVFSPRTRHLE